MLRKYELRNMGGERLGWSFGSDSKLFAHPKFEVDQCELAELGLAEN